MIDHIVNKLGIELNDMQASAMDAILHTGHDVVILSPTGSGKTFAYLLPLTQLVDALKDEVQAVVIVPGRELALQSAGVLQNMGAGLRAMACYGGRATMDENRMLKTVKPQVIFATPGRLNDHLNKGNISADTVRFLVIDEFDKCLEMGFEEEMSQVLSALPMVQRRFLLSATDAEAIPDFVQMVRTVKVDYLADEEQISARVVVYAVKSPEKDKLKTLEKLLCTFGNQRSIVFLNHRESVERTAGYLQTKGFTLCFFHGGLEQKQREDALYRFSNGSANVFVSTDLASRGLDIPDIDNIIHYHLPESEEGYIHRVGRTARWDKNGKAFFILNSDENVPTYVNADLEAFELTEVRSKPAEPLMATLYIGKGKKDRLSKSDIVGFLCKKGGLKNNQIGRIDVKDRYAYAAIHRHLLKQVIRQVQGEKIKGLRTVVEEVH